LYHMTAALLVRRPVVLTRPPEALLPSRCGDRDMPPCGV